MHNRNLPITYSLVLIQVKTFQHLLGFGENEKMPCQHKCETQDKTTFSCLMYEIHPAGLNEYSTNNTYMTTVRLVFAPIQRCIVNFRAERKPSRLSPTQNHLYNMLVQDGDQSVISVPFLSSSIRTLNIFQD